MLDPAVPAAPAALATLADLVRGGDAGALRLLEEPSDRVLRAVTELCARRPTLEELDARLRQLRAAILAAAEEVERANYRAQVIEVQATLLEAEAPRPARARARGGAAGTSAGARRSVDPRLLQRARLERQAAELRAAAARREQERRRLEEEQALLLAVLAALSQPQRSEAVEPS